MCRQLKLMKLILISILFLLSFPLLANLKISHLAFAPEENNLSSNKKILLKLIRNHVTDSHIITTPELSLSGYLLKPEEIKKNSIINPVIELKEFIELAKQKKKYIQLGGFFKLNNQFKSSIIVISPNGKFQTYQQVCTDNQTYDFKNKNIIIKSINNHRIAFLICCDIAVKGFINTLVKNVDIVLTPSNWTQVNNEDEKYWNKASKTLASKILVRLNRTGKTDFKNAKSFNWSNTPSSIFKNGKNIKDMKSKNNEFIEIHINTKENK